MLVLKSSDAILPSNLDTPAKSRNSPFCGSINFEDMKGHTGESPYAIHIPIFEDPNPRFSRFRALLDVDETIQGISTDSYFKYWGVRYNLEAQIRVFDVQRRLLIDAEYMTQKEYWETWKRERDKEHAIAQQTGRAGLE